ncbi:hypothetical protein SESBI_50507 [Sesbania bispinosa]|nr:hypothetical protein SESBI_50507 [Sesbania bispinosa]
MVKAKQVLKQGFRMDFNCGNTSIWYSGWTSLGPLCNLLPFVHISDTQRCVKDLWNAGGWDFSLLYTLILEAIQTHICSIPIPPSAPVETDSWSWWPNSDHKYKAKSGYLWLQEHLRLFDHPEFYMGDIMSWLRRNFRGLNGSIFLSVVWWIWRWRNNSVFNSDNWNANFVIQQILLMSMEFDVSGLPDDNESQAPKHFWWSAPPDGTFKLNVDRSFQGQTHMMFAGGIIRNSKGH